MINGEGENAYLRHLTMVGAEKRYEELEIQESGF
jgi:hypothetical protein